MSKIARAIAATGTGNYAAPTKFNYTDVTMKSTKVPGTWGDIVTQYRIEARLGADAWVSPETIVNNEQNALEHAIMSIKRAVVEEIFGEFRPIIYQMNTALYEKDTVRLATLLATLEHQMFTDGTDLPQSE